MHPVEVESTGDVVRPASKRVLVQTILAPQFDRVSASQPGHRVRDMILVVRSEPGTRPLVAQRGVTGVAGEAHRGRAGVRFDQSVPGGPPQEFGPADSCGDGVASHVKLVVSHRGLIEPIGRGYPVEALAHVVRSDVFVDSRAVVVPVQFRFGHRVGGDPTAADSAAIPHRRMACPAKREARPKLLGERVIQAEEVARRVEAPHLVALHQPLDIEFKP